MPDVLGDTRIVNQRTTHIPNIWTVFMQVSDMVVQTVCQIEAGLSSFPDHQGAWLSQLLLALTRHTNVWQALLCHVWVLLTNHVSF